MAEEANRARIFHLTDKLSGLAFDLQGQRSSRIEQVEQRLKILSDKVMQNQMAEDTQFEQLKNAIIAMQDSLSREKAAREVLGRAKELEEEICIARLSLSFEKNKDSTKAAFFKVMAQTDEQLQGLKERIGKEEEEVMAAHKRLMETQQTRFPRLRETLEVEIHSKHTMFARVRDQIDGELDRLYAAIDAEKRAREESDGAILEAFETVVVKLQKELELERTARARTESTLLSFLDETAAKIGDAHGLYSPL